MPRKNRKKFDKRNALIISIVGLAALILILLLVFGNYSKPKKITSINENWLAETCDCIEHNKLTCKDGFEIKETICVNETLNAFTNPILGCSAYNCSGQIYNLSNNLLIGYK